jgi:hypothetical protein
VSWSEDAAVGGQQDTQSEISTRHLSFLETAGPGPAEPCCCGWPSSSRVPLRERNHLLLAGVYAPAFGQDGPGRPADGGGPLPDESGGPLGRDLMARFGTPLDVTASELAIESFFPADPGTGSALRQLVVGAPGVGAAG